MTFKKRQKIGKLRQSIIKMQAERNRLDDLVENKTCQYPKFAEKEIDILDSKIAKINDKLELLNEN